MYSHGYMAQFVVAAKDEALVAPAISEHYPNDNLKLWTGVWLVSDDSSTAQQVAVKLGSVEGALGILIVVSIAGYWGHAQKNVWEWLAVKGTPKHGSST
jgi:hypothetical protein